MKLVTNIEIFLPYSENDTDYVFGIKYFHGKSSGILLSQVTTPAEWCPSPCEIIITK